MVGRGWVGGGRASGLFGFDAEGGDAAFSGCEPAGGGGGVGDPVEGGDGGEDGGEAFDEEEGAPGVDGAAEGAVEFHYAPGEGGGEGGCERGCADLEADAVGEFFPAVEECHVEGDAGAEGCFGYAKEGAEHEELWEGGCEGLAGCDEAP